MTLTAFPTDLPAPLIDGYSFGPLNSFRRVDVSDGPPRYRLNTPLYTSLFEIQWLFTELELQTFRLWYEGFSNLNFNRWFTIQLAVGRASPDSALLPRLLQTLEAHFYEDWTASLDQNSNRWIVSATLETRYAPVEVGVAANVIDAGNVTEALPTDDIDARNVTDPLPEDIIDGATPTFWL